MHLSDTNIFLVSILLHLKCVLLVLVLVELGLVPAGTDSDWDRLGHFKIAQNKGVDLLSLSVIVVMMEISSDLI